MNLEQLTKHQIVLLTLLVSFVTSIATGIVTVSLMDQAPPSITRTINQIVEHTVQTVVPATQGAAPVTTKTVVVKDDDLAAQSIGSVQKAIVRIVVKGGEQLVARGVITNSKGAAITDAAALADLGATEFEAIMFSGDRIPLTVRAQATTTAIAVIDIAVGTSTGFAPAAIIDKSKLQLGQSVIRIGGTGQDIVGVGVVAALPTRDSNVIETTVPTATAGSVILSLFGEVIGIATAESLALGADFYTMALSPGPQPTPAETKKSP